jgi:hypothetical protein
MKIAIDFRGGDAVMRALRLLGEKSPDAMGKALYQEANDIIREAKALTPYDTGVLHGSAFVNLPEARGAEVSVTLGYGQAAKEYAELQHEELSYYHKPPTQAKFLEQPFHEAANNGMGQRIAYKLQQEFK